MKTRILLSIVPFVLSACATAVKTRQPNATAEFAAASGQDDPFLGCRLNLLNAAGGVLQSAPFNIKLHGPEGIYYEAQINGVGRVKIMHNFGRLVNLNLDGEVSNQTESFFSVMAIESPGSYSLSSTYLARAREAGFGSPRVNSAAAVFDFAVDEVGRLRGGVSGSGSRGGDDLEDFMNTIRTNFGLGVWAKADGVKHQVLVVSCGVLG